ncbi:MAG: homoserine O-acetyltransferase [Candidatus Rokubacteria bacterium]|nr:homoserine O-acetyltransferase [Candidatus Rokubacteria bacterium]MBI3109059.1 homoserine O-acetyltransferase [Candidatus Rokubacteria bacterium]
MKRMTGLIVAVMLLAVTVAAQAYDGPVEKKTFSMPAYTTVGGQTIKSVRIGYETYGTLNAARDNVILIGHGFSGNSHAAGKYKATDPAPGYWDGIIGAGKPVDTDKFFVIATDSLANLNVKDPTVVTTGPASINPDTGKAYGLSFPIVTIRDFVNVQKALLDSLGITRLRAAMGPSMGSIQSFEWAAANPAMVERVIAVIPTAELDAFTIGWANIWAQPIMLDPRWNNGDYYGKDEPTAGLAASLKIVTLHSRHYGWADKAFGRKWAAPDRDPAKALGNKFAIEAVLEQAAAARARVSDANSFLYLVKANQLFVTGHKGSLEAGLADVKAKVLLIPAQSDLLLFPEYAKRVKAILEKQGKQVEYFEIEGDGGHLDGAFLITKAGEVIRQFLSQ